MDKQTYLSNKNFALQLTFNIDRWCIKVRGEYTIRDTGTIYGMTEGYDLSH